MANLFEQFQTDTIRIISKDGSRISSDYKAHVTVKKISLYVVDIDVSEGDFIERDLPNNRKESYEILSANFHSEFHGIPAHYIFEVRKTTAINPKESSKNIYNLSGNNVRVYHNSHDQSTNIVNIDNEEVFDLLRKVISNNVENNGELLHMLAELKQSAGKSNYLKNYTSFIANAANHMSLIGPYIPALTSFLNHI